MEERIILSIELQKGQNEKEIDALTRKITELQQATANLQKQNNELIKTGKQNSEEYVENTRQIEINKQKITEAVSARKGMVQSLLAEDNSIKALNVRNKELINQRNLISTATKEGRAEIARINAEIDRNNEAIIKNSSALEKQRFNVGNYKSALEGVSPALANFVGGLQSAGTAAKGFLVAFGPFAPLILLVSGALAALTSWFKRTEEGGDTLNKIIFTMEAIMGNLGDAAAAVGKFLFDAFNNPKQAVQDLGKFLQDQLVNRFVGMLNLIPRLATAVELLFSGEFSEAAKVAGDAVGQVVLGIENATDKVLGFIDGIAASVDDALRQGERLAALDKLLGDQEEALTVQRSKTALEVAKIREEALRLEGELRKQKIQEAIALEQQLSDAEVAHAATRLRQAKEQQEVDGVTGETKLKVAQAEAAVLDAQAARFQATLRFQKELAAIDEASAKEQAALLAEANKMVDDAAKLELENQKRIQAALIETEEIRLEAAVANAQGTEERINREIELETFKTFTLLENTALFEEERQAIIEKSQANINAIIVKGNAELAKKEEEQRKKDLAAEKLLQQQKTQGREAAANAAVGFARLAFGETKGVAIAEATINTIQGVARALKDYIFPYSLIVGALVGAAGLLQVNKIINTKPAARGMWINGKRGGIARGPSHALGGIPFTVDGVGGYEMEGNEVIINKKSSKMFRPLLSKINEAGGGVPFEHGGQVRRFQTGSIIGATQTRQAAGVVESRAAIRDAVLLAVQNMPPTIVSVVDINERASEVAENTNKAFVA